MIKKKPLSMTVPERLLEEADRVRAMWGQSRAFVMTRWMLEGSGLGMNADEVLEYFPSGLGRALENSKKNREVSATGEAHPNGGPVPVFGPTPLADSGFDSLRQQGINPEHVEKVVKLATTDRIYQTLADNLKTQKDPFVVDDAAATEFIKNIEPPKVPEEHLVNLKLLQEAAEQQLGAKDLADMLESDADPHGRTIKGVAMAEQQQNDKSKKIAKVSSPDAPTPKIGEKCPHGWANWLQCDKCNTKLAEEEF